MIVIKIFSVIVLICSVFWFISEPDYEPAIVAISSLSGLILLWVKEKKAEIDPSQNQIIGESGFGIQARRDVNMVNVNMDKEKSKNAK